MIEKYNPRESNSFERKIKKLSSSKEEVSKKRELLKKEFQEAIDQDRDSTELYVKYCTQSEEHKKQMDKYDDEIKFLKSKKEQIGDMPIYSKDSEYQDEQLQGDAVYEYLKKKNDKESLKAMRERTMSFDQYMTILYTELKDQPESTENIIKNFMEKFKSGSAVLDVKVGQKGSGRGIRIFNEEGKFETEIGEEYVLTRLSRYFMKTQKVTLEDLKKNIKFPEGVEITKPEDVEIKFECGDMKGTIRVKFTMLDSETVHQNVWNPDEDENNSEIENNEESQKKKPSPKELYDSLEEFIKWYLGIKNLKDASDEDLKYLIGSLEKDESMYEGFCKECKGEILNDNDLEFPSSFKEFLTKIAPIKLDEEKLVAILKSNYKKRGEKGGELIFDARGFDAIDMESFSDSQFENKYQILKEKYRKRADYNRENLATPKELIEEICRIERIIIDTYYPHLKKVYIK